MHAQQALVLVNYGAATGEQVQAFAERVRALGLDMHDVAARLLQQGEES